MKGLGHRWHQPGQSGGDRGPGGHGTTRLQILHVTKKYEGDEKEMISAAGDSGRSLTDGTSYSCTSYIRSCWDRNPIRQLKYSTQRKFDVKWQDFCVDQYTCRLGVIKVGVIKVHGCQICTGISPVLNTPYNITATQRCQIFDCSISGRLLY